MIIIIVIIIISEEEEEKEVPKSRKEDTLTITTVLTSGYSDGNKRSYIFF